MVSIASVCLTLLSVCSALSKAVPSQFKQSPRSSSISPALETSDVPTYPFYLQDSGHPPPAWISNATSWFDPSKTPNTGITRNYDFFVARGTLSPDGVEKSMLLINGRFPGPTIEANWGDLIQVTVHNNIDSPVEGTSLHWHGLLQKETPWYDGVPSVSQCPIAPGSSFTYTFRADIFGSSWYHSHYSAQYADGLFGPMIIHGPSQQAYDVDLGPVMISDLYHTDYFTLIQQVTGLDQSLWGPSSDNNLINGRGNFSCSSAPNGSDCQENAPLAQFHFQSGKTHRLRLVNSGAEGFEYFTIDGHVMTVIANDFVPVQPYNTTVVTLGIGQRTDVLVHANANSTGAFWMRANNSEICGRTLQPNALAAVYYENADTTKEPQSIAWPFADGGRCNNDALDETVPYYPIPAPVSRATLQTLEISKSINSTGHQVWEVNNSSFRGNYNHPILGLSQQGNYSYPQDPEWNVYNFGSNASFRLVLNNNAADSTLLSHPMHIHGHDFFVVAEGEGRWDGTTTVRLQNPQRRDTQMLRRAGYVVLDVVTDNPGVWAFHCHIAFHVSEGLYINILEQPQNITQPQIPAILQETCDGWNAYSSNNTVDQLDSGLRKNRLKLRN